MQVFCCINAKGGVGKTTVATNLAYELSQKHRVLVIDLDPQSNSTSMFLHPETEVSFAFDLLTKKASLDDVTTKGFSNGQKLKNLDLIPSDGRLGTGLADIEKMRKRDFLLSDQLRKVKDKYDFVFIDSSPQFGLLHWIALNCLELEGVQGKVLIPVEVGRHSIEGTAKLLRTLRESFDMEDENIDYIIVQNKRDERVQTLNRYLEEVLKDSKMKAAKTTIPLSVDVPKAELYRQPLSTFNSKSKATKAMISLSKEII